MLATLFGFAPTASAQLAPNESRVTLVHGILGVPVDVYVEGGLVSDADGFSPTESIGPIVLPAGDYDAQIFPHTVTPAPATPPAGGAVITQTLTLPAGVNVSVVAQSKFTPTGGELVLTPFVNDLSIPPPGLVRVTARHVANADSVDVYADGAKVIDALPSGAKSDFLVPAGTYTVAVYETGDVPGTDDPVAGPADVDVSEGNLEAIYVAGDVNGTIPLTVFTRQPAIPSSVTLLHLIPNTPVDVYIAPDGDGDGPGLYAAGFQPFTTAAVAGGLVGTYDILIYAAIPNPPALASGRADDPVITALDTPVPGGLRLSVTANLTETGDPELSVFINDVSPASAGLARVAIRHVAEAPAVDVYVGGTAPANRIVTNLAPGAETVLEIPAPGALPVGAVIVVPAGADPTNPATPRITNTAPITINAGNFYAIYAAGSVPDGTAQLFVRSLPLQKLVNPVTPTRIADTRDGTGVVQARLQPGEVLKVSANGVGGVPNTGADAVVLNVTAAAPSADGYLTVYPCGPTAPNASNVNYTAGQIAEPNAVIADLNLEGDFCITSYAETDVIVDVNAWLAGGSGYVALPPERILDTRDGTGTLEEPLLPGEILVVDVTDDADYGGAVLNVTAANTTAPGYLTVYPCDADVPYASNVNYEAGQLGSPNAVLTGLDEEGDVCITTYAPVDVFVDLQGLFTTDAPFLGLAPERIYDTRDGNGGAPIGTLDPGETAVVQVVDPEDVTLGGINAVALNVTATEAEADGYLTVYACGGAAPYASSVNYTTDELSSPNAVVIGVSNEGTVCITSYAPVDVIVDLTGLFAG